MVIMTKLEKKMATLLDVKCVYFSSEHLWADIFLQ